MKFEESGIQDQTAEESNLTTIMRENGFVLGAHWDYDRVTYDRRMEIKDDVFYLRVQGQAIEGEVGGRYAIIKLLTPILGQFHYPHTMEYGEDKDLPNTVIEQCKKVLSRVKEGLDNIQSAE